MAKPISAGEKPLPLPEGPSSSQPPLFASALQSLSDEQRRAIELRYQHDFSFPQIASHLNVREDAAWRIWSQAIRQLLPALRDSGTSDATPRTSGSTVGNSAWDDVEALVAYDEQLRQGVEIIATGSKLSESPTPPEELTDCLRAIERVWPRGRQSGPKKYLPSRIGRFETESVLGQGSFGIVYLARDPLLGRKVALKVPRLHALTTEGLREQFRREGRATAALDHPNIVPVHEFGEAGPVCYIALAYCEGPSLAQWLKERSTPVPHLVAARLVQQLAEAMHYSHRRGVLHRDLKPTNVLLFPSDAVDESELLPFVPRIVDFGLARLVEEDLEATGTSAVVGTPLYMAPEQATGRPEAIGPAADIYALGSILYELLGGRPPFPGVAPLEVLERVRNSEPQPLRQIRPDVPRDLETVCLRCLQKQPEDRYESAQALAEDLHRYLSGREVAARPISFGQRLLRVCQHPQRIREAGLTVIAAHAAVALSMLMTLYMVGRAVAIELPADFSLVRWSLPALLIMLTSHIPMIYVGWMLVQQRVWAAWVSMIAGAAMTLAALLFVFGLLPAGVSYWDDIPGFRVVYPLMAVILAVQTAMSAVALMALRRLHNS